MKYLDSSTTHSAYSALVQKEWQRTAKEKKEFYEGLSPRAGLQQRVTRANKVLDKANASKARGTFFPDEVFETYKKIKQACAYTIGMIYSANPGMDEEGLQKLRVAAIKFRNEQIARLLNEYAAIIQSQGNDNRRNMVNADGSVELYPQAQFRAY